MKKFLFGLGLGLAVMLAFFVWSVLRVPDTSETAWRKASGYKGDICSVAVTGKNVPYCSNGVKYSPGSVNAEEGYQLWATCQLYPDAPVCGELND